MTQTRRELLVSVAFAAWGFAIAIATITIFRRVAPADQLMGFAKSRNFDAHGPMRWMLALMVTPALLPFVLRPLARRIAAGRFWASVTTVVAALVSLWIVTVTNSVLWTAAPCAAIVVICATLANHRAAFTRRDVVLVPVFLTTLLAVIDIAPRFGLVECVSVAALLVFSLRVAVSMIPSPLPPAFAFLFAPSALVLQTGFFARDERYFGWPSLLIVVVTPPLVRVFWRNRARAGKLLMLVAYPLSIYAYTNAISMSTGEGKPRMNFFEDGHALLPASEYLRGERAYRDILPGHGLIEDGLIDAVVFQGGEVTAGRRTKAREVIGGLNGIALYALAFAVTGSAEGAFLTVFLSIMMGAFAPTIRMLPPMATLAFIAGAIRWRKPRWFAYAATGTVLCGLTSLDFGAYTFVALVIALLRTRPRTASWRFAAIGWAAAGIPLAASLAAFGILDDFVRSTFFEVPTVAAAYNNGFFVAPELLQPRGFFPEALAVALDTQVFHYIGWAVVAVLAGAALTRRWPRRIEPMVLVGAFVVLTGISYAERHHIFFGMPLAVVLGGAASRLFVRRSALAVPMLIALIVLAKPTVHAAVLDVNRGTRAPAGGWGEVRDVPRAAGALWTIKDAAAIESVKKYVSLSLAPGETFFDFTNSGILYFLFRRDCPIRWYEVSYYQTEERQREVIARLEANPKVRAVLLPSTPKGRISIDGIPNAWRAPLVDQYIRDHFEPDFEEGEVVFWRRK